MLGALLVRWDTPGDIPHAPDKPLPGARPKDRNVGAPIAVLIASCRMSYYAVDAFRRVGKFGLEEY